MCHYWPRLNIHGDDFVYNLIRHVVDHNTRKVGRTAVIFGMKNQSGAPAPGVPPAQTPRALAVKRANG